MAHSLNNIIKWKVYYISLLNFSRKEYIPSGILLQHMSVSRRKVHFRRKLKLCQVKIDINA